MRFLALLNGQRGGIFATGISQIFMVLGFGYFLVAAATQYQRYSEAFGSASSPLTSVGPLLIFASILCGATLGLQFWLIGFRRTWHFLLHRSVSRTTILLSMITAAVITLVVFTGGCWTLLFLYASLPGLFILPPTFRVYTEGWLFISLGLVFYFGVALSGISTAKWYTTKMFGIAFAGIILIVTFMSLDILWAFAVIAAGIFILATQLFSVFLNREF